MANRSLLYRLLSENLRAQAPWYALATVAMLVVAGMTAMSAWIMKDIVNETVVSKDMNRMFMLAGGVAAIFIVKGIATYFQIVILSKAGNNIIARTQSSIFSRILQQDLNFFIRFPSSDLVMRLTNNAQAARTAMDLILTSAIRDLFSLIGLVIVMFIQQPVLSLVSFILGPAAFIGVRYLTNKVRDIMKQELTAFAKIIESVQEASTGVRIIKAFGLEEHMRSRMDRQVTQVEHRANSIARLSAATSPIMETLSGLAIAGVIALSGLWVVGGSQTPGELMSFITALLLAYEPAKRLARMRVNLETAMVGVRMMYEIKDHPIMLTEAENPQPVPPGGGEIIFDNVGFSYDENKPLFKNLNLVFPAGKTTALVGASGGGKSTIINLVMRMFDPEEGSVTVNGLDLRQVSFESLRAHMSYVGQDTFLFNGTVRDNLELGRQGATEEEIIEAAKSAHAHDFIMNMNKGYDSLVGENGGNLSGGQKQRLAIARAMLRDADILILDEATSALDSYAESLVQDALKRLTKDRTTIVIAHRLATITSADNIVVLENGKILEQGPQRELLAHDGPYRRLYELQILPQLEDA
ncbi:ABC transporter ATP-binding protein/permease [Martelella mediterranea]|uniref:ABC transporter ATP-binding protein n=1 Tax=Martelella mediterranea TaxID=293089 RepID=UPI001E597782|nr:ABC transporter ATP-binding protein [Martelella mediterranea]MCD1634167.1 ABC transporter ATP-binding protein/permease [Martelella mediterranea]